MEDYPQIKFFNTLSRSVENFIPLRPGEAGIYCCGPTVYNFQHIGNLRTYIFEDTLVRVLRYAGYKVTHVMNITDVGHLVSDADQGEDKMLLAARREGKTSHEIAEHYTDIFFKHCSWLNIERPTVICRATEHVPQMLGLIERLVKNGSAYESGGNVYFDVAKFPSYGALARLDLDSLKAGARIEVDEQKKNPLDFALWFTKSKFENQELQWNSPWGEGYPGWHIECSAMAMHYLGETLDIHCGGIDHIPVHHTNEIAQSEASTCKPFSRFWMHGAFLVLGKDKMSKSTGEFLTLDRVKERGFDPLSYRLFCFSANYRQELSWSWEALEAAANTLRRMKNTVLGWREEWKEINLPPEDGAWSTRAQELKRAFEQAVFDDLGMPNAIAVLHETMQEKTLASTERYRLLTVFDNVLGLGIENWQIEEVEIPAQVASLVKEREDARKARDWKKADVLREQITALGFAVEDRAGGSKVKRTS